MKYFRILFLLFFINSAFSQKAMNGQVLDFDTAVPIAFTKIEYNGNVIYANWEGKFSIEIKNDNKPIIFSYKGYNIKNYYLSTNVSFLLIKLVSDESNLNQEIFSENEVNSIMKKVIENKPKNQPEKALQSFQYKNYEHLLVSANPDSISSKIDTIYKKNLFGKNKIKIDSTNYKFKKYVEKQHIYQTEKVNLIQHNSHGTKETVLATRMAGFKKPLYEYLGLNLISYSLYDNQINILNIPLQNPISNYGRKLYTFKLIDTLEIENRKVFRIYFQPKKLKSNRLRGLLYVDAENFAIAKAFYRIYGVANINATYTFNYNKQYGIWFPKKRKFTVIKGNNSENLNIFGETVKFNSVLVNRAKIDASDNAYLRLESTPYDVEINNPITIKKPSIKIDVPDYSMNKPESYWKTFKKDTLDVRKMATYTSLDSLSVAENIEQKLFLGRKIINGYFPVSFFDIDLRSIVKYNNFEGFRLGLGGITNTKLSENYKVGFYGAYGFKDQKIKFGIMPSYLLNKETNTWLNASYIDDINEIGQIKFATENRRFKIYDPRPINISTFYNNKTFSGFLESKYIAKTDAYVGFSRSEINPLFNYTFVANGDSYTKYNITTVQVALQWNPFSNYMQTPTGRIEIEKQFPKFSIQYTKAIPNFLGDDFSFSKLDFRFFHEIPYLSGQESSFVLQGGLAFGDIPLTHLYSIAPNDLNRNSLLKRITFAGKNSFETMYFNEFFSSKYLSFQVKHTFNKVKIAYKIKPLFSVVTRMAWGTLNQKDQHIGLPFKTLEKGFIESGVEANSIFKGFGLTLFYRYGPNGLPKFEDNLALKISYVLDLGF